MPMTAKMSVAPQMPEPVFVWHNLSERGVSCVTWLGSGLDFGEMLLFAGTHDGQLIVINWVTKKLLARVDVGTNSIVSCHACLSVSARQQPTLLLCAHERSVGVHRIVGYKVLNGELQLRKKALLPTSHYGFCASAMSVLHGAGEHATINALIVLPNMSAAGALHSLDVYKIDISDANITYLDKTTTTCNFETLNTIQLDATPDVSHSGDKQRGQPLCLCLIKDTLFFAVGFENGTLSIYNLVNGTEISTLTSLHADAIFCVDFVGSIGYSGSSCQKLAKLKLQSTTGMLSIDDTRPTLDLATKTPTARNQDIGRPVLKNRTFLSGVSCLCLRRSDGRLLAVGCWDYTVRLYSTRTHTKLAAIDIHTQTITAVQFTDVLTNCDKQLLIVADKDGRVSVWDLYNEK